MLITDLITILQECCFTHGDIEVKIIWEGITKVIYSESIYKSKKGLLYIDVDDNSTKYRFAVNPTEGVQEEEDSVEDAALWEVY